jgi:alkyl sulfatase BDS1-like metallo-beta-lactamase superfamily hydrolase
MGRSSWIGMAAAVLLAGQALAGAPEHDPPSATTLAANAETAKTAPFADTRDLDFAAKGFLGTRADPLIKAPDGRVVWDLSAFDFLKGSAPGTVNPSLWRHSGLLAKHGLFQVTDRIFQVRGFDIANTTFIKGDTGWIVIDTLTSTETAKAAYDLVTEKLGKRPVVAVIYTHSHADHFGGTAALVSQADVDAGKVQVIAPMGFTQAAVSENVIAGVAMQRRATYQFGINLPRGPEGGVGSGIGTAVSVGTQSLITPNVTIDHTGQSLTLDGVRLVFQVTPSTEAPAEMNIDFPDWRVVDMAENANVSMHNILTPRGAVVRDARGWAEYLTQALREFGDSDVMITSHGWPRFGRAEIDDFLAKHRDAYQYLHDQTVRLMNKGLTGDAIAAQIRLPKVLENEWYDRGYYGSMSFNSRAVYQFYMGWYDANPVHLSAMAPAESARKYVEALGGAAKVRALANAAYGRSDYAWAAELLNKAVFADAKDDAAKALLARCYDQLAWRSENSLWRNIYLSGASELRHGVAPPRLATPASQAGLIRNLSSPMIFDLMAVRLNPDKVGDGALKLALVFPDRKERTRLTVENGVLVHEARDDPEPGETVLTLDRTTFLLSVFTGAPVEKLIASGAIKVEGDKGALARLVSWLDAPTPDFPIVTP